LQFHLTLLLLALTLDAVIGDPDWLWRRLPHPVVLFGKLIEFVDRIGNQPHFSLSKRRIHGFMAIFSLILLAALIGWLLSWICQQFGAVGMVIEAVIASLFLAQKSLALHVEAVYRAFEQDGIEQFPKSVQRFSDKNCGKNKGLEQERDSEIAHSALEQARHEVSKIVGRAPEQLDEAGICRAAIESLSENSSDGVIAPALWFLLAGLPGILAYKMLNTADSMIGHKNDRYGAFGTCAARMDDVANYLPARITALLTVIAALLCLNIHAAKAAMLISLRDAKKHNSPNAGWPESAYAGALNISLAGPRLYGTQQLDAPFQNENGHAPRPIDIKRALSLFWSSLAVFFAILLLSLFCL